MKVFKRFVFKLRSTQEGFTLTELMMALAIIGILSAGMFLSLMATKPTRNFHAEGRDLVSNIKWARAEAVNRGTCVGIVFFNLDVSGVAPTPPAPSYTIFIDNGAGVGGVACNAIMDGTESAVANTIKNVEIREGISLTTRPIAAGDTNPIDVFTAVSFNQRSLVAARIIAGGAHIALGNDALFPLPEPVTMWSRVIVFQSGGVELQTNNNPLIGANWD